MTPISEQKQFSVLQDSQILKERSLDLVALGPMTVRVLHPTTRVRDLIVFNELVFKQAINGAIPTLVFRDICVIGKVTFRGIRVKARYVTQMTQEQFSRGLYERSLKTIVSEQDDLVPTSCSKKTTFTLTSDINAFDFDGFTTLMKASRFEDHERVQFLLDAKADPGVVNEEGWSALKLATLANSRRGVNQLILAKADVEVRDLAENTPLLTACAHNCDNAVGSLLMAKANAHVKNKFGTTPLLAATKSGAVEIVNWLVNAKANVYEEFPSDPRQMLPCAMYTAANGFVEDLRQLLEEGLIDLEATNDAYQTPLLLAARFGRAKAVRLLLDAKANIEAHSLGETALIRAAREGHLEVVKVLIDAKANVNAKDFRGTALKGAIDGEHSAVIAQLAYAVNASLKEECP